MHHLLAISLLQLGVFQIYSGKLFPFGGCSCLSSCISSSVVLTLQEKNPKMFQTNPAHSIEQIWAIPENKEIKKKWKFSYFCQRHALSTSFDIFVVTYRVTNFLPKVDILRKKTELPFLVFPYFRVMPRFAATKASTHLAWLLFCSS